MNVKHRWFSMVLIVALLTLSSCGKKSGESNNSGPASVSAEQITAVKNALVQGMTPIGFSSVKSAHVGKMFVVEVQTPDGGLRIAPPPPPPGMIQVVGQVTFYRGELDSVSADGLTVRKAYPTAGNFKKIEIPKGDIRSIYVAP